MLWSKCGVPWENLIEGANLNWVSLIRLLWAIYIEVGTEGWVRISPVKSWAKRLPRVVIAGVKSLLEKKLGKTTGAQLRRVGAEWCQMRLSGRQRSHPTEALEGHGEGLGFCPKGNWLLLKSFEQKSEWHVLIDILRTFWQPCAEYMEEEQEGSQKIASLSKRWWWLRSRCWQER